MNGVRVTLIIGALGGGGAERSILLLADGLVKLNFDVTLLTLRADIPDAYTVPPKVRRIYASPPPHGWQRWFDFGGQIERLKRKWIRLRKIHLRRDILSTEPDIVIAYIDITNILVIRVLRDTKIPVVVTERTDLRINKIGWIWTLLRHLYYPLAARVVVQTEELRDWIQKRRYPWRVVAIPNAVLPPPDAIKNIPAHPGKTKHLTAVGRLAPVKQFDHLLTAFANVVRDCPEWQLTLFGDGDLKVPLKRQIQRLGLQSHVMLPGRVSEPAVYLKNADLFVMTSQYEGFPNALCEAMACGLPAISYNCPSGPRAIIRHEVDGLLVPANDIDALSQALVSLMQNDERRWRLAARAPDVLSRFSVKEVIEQWQFVIEAAIGSP
ncbi:glycosyltransferase family 4 protein [bacterium]|nr:glycosyltransferase family 4 protein [bacterium]